MSTPRSTPWPHAPTHRLSESGTYMITAGTHEKQHFYDTSEKLDMLVHELLSLAAQYGWELEAWAVFSNHYHFVARSAATEKERIRFFRHVHANTSRAVNRIDGREGRRTWHNYWDTKLTFERSYLARLNYVHQNAVKHGLVVVANQYPWCSTGWFERTATHAQVATVYGFETDKVNELDEFEPVMPLDMESRG